MNQFQELAIRKQIEQLSQSHLSIALTSAVEAIDDEHLVQALKMMSDNELRTLVAQGILEQREREGVTGSRGIPDQV